MMKTIHNTAQQGFGQQALAARYQQVRPDYPHEIVDWLHTQIKINADSKVIDLGAGTGKFLPYLKALTAHINAVEPVAAMRHELKLHYPDIHTLDAYSGNIPLQSSSMDAVVCAQSFHWFANHESLAEIYRLLKPKAALGLIWNQRDTSIDWVAALAEVLLKLEKQTDTPRFHSFEWQQAFESQPWFLAQAMQTFNQQQTGSVENVVSKRLLSTSFIAAMPEQDQQQLKQEFEQIIFKYTGKKPDQQISFPYITYAYAFQSTKIHSD